MTNFFLKIFLQKLFTLLLISILSFLVIKLAPGEPSQIDPLNPRFTQADIERFRKAFDFDKPLYQQYFLFYKKFFSGELRSYQDNEPVFSLLWERFKNSFWLFAVATLLTWTLAFPTGIFSALRRGKVVDRFMTFFSYALISIPSFVLAYLLILFTVRFLKVPFLGQVTFGLDEAPFWLSVQDRIWHLVLPSIISSAAGIAVLSRYVRDQALEVLGHDYMRTAWSKGLTADQVHYDHGLPNTLIPFVTMFGLLIPGLIGGSVIIESIFAWPGMGRLAYEALLARNYPVIIALNFVSAILVLIGTLISDILYMFVDPRIRLA